MRRTIGTLLGLTAAVAFALVPTTAGASVNNYGCPPESSNFKVVTDFEAQAELQLQAGLDAGWTLQEIADYEGLVYDPSITDAQLKALLLDAYMSIVGAIDKNQDGILCFIDYWGRTNTLPWAGSAIDNVLPY